MIHTPDLLQVANAFVFLAIPILNRTFRDTDGQGRVSARIAMALQQARHRVTLVEWEVRLELAEPQLCEVVELGPGAWPTALLRNASFSWHFARSLGRLRGEDDLVFLNGGMTFVPANLDLCHFVHTQNRLSVASAAAAWWGVGGVPIHVLARGGGLGKRSHRLARGVVAVPNLVPRHAPIRG